ncbi:MAG TPA: ABC transporter substrate-binding protein, partial [Thermomicrobiales bacterium]|nr:ABC transporter substrate-binding protein [Thermomicrobiales bacterium]
MNGHFRSRKALGIAVASALALALTGCGGGDNAGRSGDAAEGAPSPGITDSAVTLGITTPLSGATAGPGTCTVAGVKAYFGAKNAEGGVKFGDGKTRTVDIKALDDTYDPQKAKANYDQLKDDVFAMTAGLGTPTNRAWRDAAIADEVPQVLIMTGDPIFSDAQESPWQLGFVPKYQNEGEA